MYGCWYFCRHTCFASSYNLTPDARSFIPAFLISSQTLKLARSCCRRSSGIDSDVISSPGGGNKLTAAVCSKCMSHHTRGLRMLLLCFLYFGSHTTHSCALPYYMLQIMRNGLLFRPCRTSSHLVVRSKSVLEPSCSSHETNYDTSCCRVSM